MSFYANEVRRDMLCMGPVSPLRLAVLNEMADIFLADAEKNGPEEVSVSSISSIPLIRNSHYELWEFNRL